MRIAAAPAARPPGPLAGEAGQTGRTAVPLPAGRVNRLPGPLSGKTRARSLPVTITGVWKSLAITSGWRGLKRREMLGLTYYKLCGPPRLQFPGP
jgi:hypothetical protein